MNPTDAQLAQALAELRREAVARRLAAIKAHEATACGVTYR